MHDPFLPCEDGIQTPVNEHPESCILKPFQTRLVMPVVPCVSPLHVLNESNWKSSPASPDTTTKNCIDNIRMTTLGLVMRYRSITPSNGLFGMSGS